AELQAGASGAATGAAQLRAGLDAAAAGSAQGKSGAEALSAGLEQYAAAHPELADDAAFRQLLGSAKAVSSGVGAAASGQLQLAAGAADLAAGGERLNSGMQLFAQKLAEAQQGGLAMQSGAQSLAGGSEQLQAGLNRLSGGVRQLTDGVQQLEQGAGRLSEGSATVVDGTKALSGQLAEAAAQTSGIHAGDDTIQMVASPVDVEEERLNPVANYGTGFAPYFVSLGLFVGALMLTIVFPVREPAGLPRSGWRLFLGKLGIMLLVGAIQAVLVDLVLLLGLGLEVQSVALFFVFSLLSSWTYMALIQLFVTTMGDPGRFVAVVVLILQLTTSAGTFPTELIPNTLQHVGAWLPMFYTVAGYKAVISSGDFGVMWSQAGVLAIFLAGSALLTLVYFITKHRRQQPTLIAQA
ncbi:YhgE/Pip family protein, partial [Paenibacillus koleovorans]|uniref:YhgE/Pip family protein n=1 Tax=Paenibacillus koleovorans TaxID=121608 RepID=UPI0013E29BD0